MNIITQFVSVAFWCNQLLLQLKRSNQKVWASCRQVLCNSLYLQHRGGWGGSHPGFCGKILGIIWPVSKAVLQSFIRNVKTFSTAFSWHISIRIPKTFSKISSTKCYLDSTEEWFKNCWKVPVKLACRHGGHWQNQKAADQVSLFQSVCRWGMGSVSKSYGNDEIET